MAQDNATPETTEEKATAAAPEVAEKPAEAATAAPKAAQSGQAAEASASKKRNRPGVPPRRGKKLRNTIKNQLQKIDKDGTTTLKKAIGTLKSMKRAKFDETLEIHMKLGVDTTQAEQSVRGSVPLPHGIGKAVRIVVFCQGDDVAKAKEAGTTMPAAMKSSRRFGRKTGSNSMSLSRRKA